MIVADLQGIANKDVEAGGVRGNWNPKSIIQTDLEAAYIVRS